MNPNVKFRPLLAAKVDDEEDLNKLRYPVLVSPKIDGIRCIVHPELGPVTRSLKPLPNLYTRNELTRLGTFGCDGELVVGGKTEVNAFNMTTRGIMSYGGEPNFTYLIFDSILPENPFQERLRIIQNIHGGVSPKVQLVTHFGVDTPAELLQYEKLFLSQGYEGLMIRDPNGRYKYNRSTFKEGILIKLKRLEDAEAEVIGFEELVHNDNEPQKNRLGLTERSDHQANWRPGDTLGALIVRADPWGDFKIGSGFDQTKRLEIWRDRDSYLGRTVTFKFLPTGTLEKPRHPIFKGFRED